MATIGRKTLNAVAVKLNQHLIDYQKEIDEAYAGEDVDTLTVSMSAKFSPYPGGVKVDTSISFTKEKIKDGSTFSVDENQLDLPME